MSLDIIYWHDQALTNHNALVTAAAADGYRTKSLSIYGDPASALYAAVMIKRQAIIAEEQYAALTLAQFQQTFDQMSGKGWAPYILSATGPAANPLIAVCFWPLTPTPLTRLGMTQEEFDTYNLQALANDQILAWADMYGDTADVRYAAIWYPNPKRTANSAQTAWCADGSFDDLPTTQARFDAMLAARGRLFHIAAGPGGHTLTAYQDTQLAPWTSRAGMSSADYQTELDSQLAQGLSPVCVNASGSGPGTTFSAIFAGTEETVPRTFRSTTSSPTIPGIDDTVQAFMLENDVRGTALAICKGASLVYAKGFTWAEAGYPDVQETTCFRMASLSKTITAFAIYQLIEEGTLGLSTPVNSVLNLPIPSGSLFGQVTIQDLLEMRSGIADVANEDLAIAGSPANLPVTVEALAAYCAQQNVPFLRDITKVSYNNTGYTLLGLVVSTLRHAPTLEDAVIPTIFGPLNITRIRRSRSLLSDQPTGEAFYFPRMPAPNDADSSEVTQLLDAISVMTPQQPIVPYLYGDICLENGEGAGGISAAVTDYARLLAILNINGNTPILTQATLDLLLANAATASADSSGPIPANVHGYDGFDSVTPVTPGSSLYTGSKGGYLWTATCVSLFTQGGFTYLFCANGNTNVANVNGQPWNVLIANAAEAYDWGTVDRFPDYGMPSFGSMGYQTYEAVLREPVGTKPVVDLIPSRAYMDAISRRSIRPVSLRAVKSS